MHIYVNNPDDYEEGAWEIMALEEKTVLDMASWRPEFGTIEVRMANLILRDGKEISKEYHRHVVEPTQEDLSKEHPDVQAIAEAHADKRAAKAAEPKIDPMTASRE